VDQVGAAAKLHATTFTPVCDISPDVVMCMVVCSIQSGVSAGAYGISRIVFKMQLCSRFVLFLPPLPPRPRPHPTAGLGHCMHEMAKYGIYSSKTACLYWQSFMYANIDACEVTETCACAGGTATLHLSICAESNSGLRIWHGSHGVGHSPADQLQSAV
jgi:hypothetical protein